MTGRHCASIWCNLDGQLTERTRCVDVRGLRSTYDAAGRLAMVYRLTSWRGRGCALRLRHGGSVAPVGGYRAHLQLDDRDASITLGNGVTTTTTYEASRRWIESVTATSPVQGQIYRASYTHDAVGRIRTVDERNAVTASLVYSFDDLGRLIDVAASDAARSERFAVVRSAA
jgi:hypothetical protein